MAGPLRGGGASSTATPFKERSSVESPVDVVGFGLGVGRGAATSISQQRERNGQAWRRRMSGHEARRSCSRRRPGGIDTARCRQREER